MLRPGPGVKAGEVALSQRERLFAAMVAVVSERGYSATTVADVVELSGVSRKTFYEHFKGKQDCFLAAVEELMQGSIAIATRRYEKGEGSAAERAEAALGALIELVAAQPAAARMSLVEAYAAGPAGIALIEGAAEELGRLAVGALDRVPGHEGTPPELVRAVTGGLYRVIYRHLQQGTERELIGLAPELWKWAMSHTPPPTSLRSRGRRAGPAPETMPPFAVHSRGERVLRAFAAVVAERGFGGTTIAEIATRASISQNTFYAHFKSKEDALMAALDSSGAQLLAATLPAVRRSIDGPDAVRTALASVCGFLASEPAFARLRAVEVYAVGPTAIEHRDKAAHDILDVVGALPAEPLPRPGPIAIEASVGAIQAILFDTVRSGGPESLPGVVPLATYVALVPLLGPEEACAVAKGERAEA